MGHSRKSKAATHEKIVRTAAQRLREQGLHGIGVADLMKEAGLTVGGFYKHFGSRDDLVAEALSAIDGAWPRAVAHGHARGLPDRKILARLVDDYLSVIHRDAPGAGCVFAALAGDLARGGDKVRDVATAELARGLDLLAGLLGDGPDARALAIVLYTSLIGAVSMARVTRDEELSREILSTVARALKELSSPPS